MKNKWYEELGISKEDAERILEENLEDLMVRIRKAMPSRITKVEGRTLEQFINELENNHE